MEKFSKKTLLERMLMEQKKLEQYYRDLRKYELETNAPLKDKKYYEKWYKILRIFFSIEMFCSFRTVKVHQDLRNNPLSKQAIYAVTHVGRFDIESSIITRKCSAAFVWGDPGKLYKSPLKFLIDRLGVIFVDTNREYDDSHVALETMIKYVNHGLNLNINPEGAWCILPNKVVMPLYDGAVITAMKCNICIPIIPVAIAFYGRRWYVSYGKEITIEPYTKTVKRTNINGDKDINEKQYIKEQSANLRDAMATLRWELICKFSGKKQYVGNENDDLLYTVKRSTLDENSYDQFINDIMKDTDNGYGIEEIEATRFRDRSNPEPKEMQKDLEAFVKEHPAFFYASNSRFVNYVNVCNSLPSILENLDEFRSRKASD